MSDQPKEHLGEDDLEPVHLIRRSDAVLKAGTMMLGAGTSSRRVKAVMRAVASALDIDSLQAQVTFTDIVATVVRRGIFRTQVAEVTKPGVNAERIALLHHLSGSLTPHMSVADVDARLAAIEGRRPLYPTWLLTILAALACASIARLNNGGWLEAGAVLPASAMAFVLHRFMGRHQVNLIASVVISTVAASSLYLLFYWLAQGGHAGVAPRLTAGFVGSVIFLVPGFPLVTGGLDVVRLDLEAGVARLAYAALVMLAMGIGIWGVASLAGVSPDAVPPLGVSAASLWFMRGAASFVAVLGWAAMFSAPRGVALASALIAVAGNALRLGLLDAGWAPHVATFFGALLIGLACHVVGWVSRLPVLIMTVPTLLVMIPGAPGVRALMYFNSGSLMDALGNGIVVVLQAIAMVAGLAAAMMLTDPEWAFTRPDPPTLASVGERIVRTARWPWVR
jgi:uncharacterized membrane protein YjjP (DUF1212 family)/uncharacterized membrane protein YjjB (DUF3815 family)